MIDINEKVRTIMYLSKGKTPSLFKSLDEKEDDYIIKKINRAYSAINNILQSDLINPRILMTETIKAFDTLEKVYEFMNHPIHINVFKNKSGNAYLQARTTIKEDNKVKWISAYIGPENEYIKGVDDPFAIMKGTTQLRKKLWKYYNI